MKLSEIKKSVTVALMTGVANAASKPKTPKQKYERVKRQVMRNKDITLQCKVIGEYYADKFLKDCMKDAEVCLKDGKKFDELMEEFNKIGARFSTEIEEES